jgi:hypothetical protein
MKFFRIPDPGWIFSGSQIRAFLVKFSLIIFRILVTGYVPVPVPYGKLYETELLLKLSPETVSSKKKLPVCFLLITLFFYLGRRIRDRGSEIRDEKILGSGIKHPGSATLEQNNIDEIFIYVILLSLERRIRIHNLSRVLTNLTIMLVLSLPVPYRSTVNPRHWYR